AKLGAESVHRTDRLRALLFRALGTPFPCRFALDPGLRARLLLDGVFPVAGEYLGIRSRFRWLLLRKKPTVLAIDFAGLDVPQRRCLVAGCVLRHAHAQR